MRKFSAAVVLFWMLLVVNSVNAIDFVWLEQNVGSQAWNADANWNGPGFPLTDEDTANLAVALSSNLDVSLPAAGVTVGELHLGGTSQPVTTSIVGGTLRIQNDFGNALIASQGISGSANVIESPVRAVNERIEFASSSTNTIMLGDFSYVGQETSLRSFMPSGLKASIDDVLLEDSSVEEGQNPILFLNDSAENQGTLEIRGTIEGTGGLSIGPSNAQVAIPLSTVVLSGNNTFAGRVTANRANIVVGSDSALGLRDYRQGQQSNQFGANLLSDDDSRRISIPMRMSQWQTIRGDHSLEWAGEVTPSNSRGFVNLLPDGKQFTLSGKVYAAVEPDNLDRRLRFDGSGTTVVTDGLHGFLEDEGLGFSGGHHKLGTGVVIVNGTSTYTGVTEVHAGTLRFADTAAFAETDSILVSGGAVGVDTGTFRNDDFIFVLDQESTGGLIIAESEANDDIDLDGIFTEVSLAGPDIGVVYTGTITPAKDTYRLGGGAGTITLPNDGQLTNARSLIATNGGVVRLLGINDYSGPTRIEGQYTTTFQEQARLNERQAASDQLYVPTTLSVQHLANGNEDSSIGRASATAANLVVQGSTFRYEGEGGSTDRLFTIGTAGATLDASGVGPIEFTNSGSLALMEAEPREGSVRGVSIDNGLIKLTLDHTDELVIGMGIEGLDNVVPGTTIRKILDETTVEMSNAVPDNPFLFERGTVSFVGVDRTLALTGTNTGRNTLTPVIADSTDAVVHVAKSDLGTWVLAGDNTYSGTTTVAAGTLLVDGEHVSGEFYTVDVDGTLGGNGRIGGDVTIAGALLASDAALTMDGTVTLSDGGGLLVDLSDLSAATPLLQLNNLDLSSDNDTLDFVLGSTASPGDYLLATYGGDLTGVIDSETLGLDLNYDTPGQIILSVLGTTSLGDFDGNGVVDLGDIDLLTPEIASGANNAAFDLNADDLVDSLDLALFLGDGIITAGNRLPGDADFDGTVAFADFLQLSGAFGEGGVWSDGDFDASGTVDFADFLLLSSNFGESAAGAAMVPEPTSLAPLSCVLLLLLVSNRRLRRVRGGDF